MLLYIAQAITLIDWCLEMDDAPLRDLPYGTWAVTWDPTALEAMRG